MVINFVVPNIAKLGGVRVALEYATRLRERGHDVKIYEPMLPYNYSEDFSFYGFLKSLYTRLNELIEEKGIFKDIGFADVKTDLIPQVNDLFLRNADYNIAINWVTAKDLSRLSLRKGKNIYFIQAYETFISDEELISKTYKLPLIKLVVSDYLKKLLWNKYSVESTCVLNGIDFNRFFNDSKIYNNDFKRIIFIEHDLQSKGVKKILSVLEKLWKKYENLKFCSFGIDKYHDLPKNIEFVRNPDDNRIRELYSSSDIFIGASESEGFYLSPAEAMACKCAVVVSKVGAVPEYSTHRVSAMHFEPGDNDEMFNNICYLLDRPDELKRISENGYNEVRKKLDWNKSITRFEEAISAF